MLIINPCVRWAPEDAAQRMLRGSLRGWRSRTGRPGAAGADLGAGGGSADGAGGMPARSPYLAVSSCVIPVGERPVTAGNEAIAATIHAPGERRHTGIIAAGGSAYARVTRRGAQTETAHMSRSSRCSAQPSSPAYQCPGHGQRLKGACGAACDSLRDPTAAEYLLLARCGNVQ